MVEYQLPQITIGARKKRQLYLGGLFFVLLLQLSLEQTDQAYPGYTLIWAVYRYVRPQRVFDSIKFIVIREAWLPSCASQRFIFKT